MLKHANHKGFTIIEVVITIAIGAAVMALVLNAVAGARRSQRNNARTSDVNQVAAGYNQYVATRNALPDEWADMSSIIDDGVDFGHYDPANINAANSWSTANAIPAAAGNFAWDADYNTAPATGDSEFFEDEGQFDYLVVINQAQCDANSELAEAGGIREAVIVYQLEGQNDTICLDI